MGSYDRAEVCELVGMYVLNTLANKYDKSKIGLYRDDGLAAFKNISGSKAEKIKKDITKIFKETGLRITIQANLKVVNFLDITLNLNNGKYYPYRKPNDNQSTSTSSPTTHLTSLRTCQIRSADASPTSRMTKKSSTKVLPSMQMHSNPAATRKTYITAMNNQKRANVTDSATSYGSTHHSAKTYQRM